MAVDAPLAASRGAAGSFSQGGGPPQVDERLANTAFRFKDHRGKWCSVTLTLSEPISIEELRANKSFLAANMFDGAMRNFDRICAEREEVVAKEA